MKNKLFIVAALWLGAVTWVFPQSSGSPAARPAATPPAAHRDVVKTYCVSCHNERLKTAGLSLDRLDFDDIAGAAEIWEKVVRKVRAGLMPPDGVRRP